MTMFHGGRRPKPRRESGQVLVIFALALIAIVAMTGLVIDGGGTFVQRRERRRRTSSRMLATSVL